MTDKFKMTDKPKFKLPLNNDMRDLIKIVQSKSEVHTHHSDSNNYMLHFLIQLSEKKKELKFAIPNIELFTLFFHDKDVLFEATNNSDYIYIYSILDKTEFQKFQQNISTELNVNFQKKYIKCPFNQFKMDGTLSKVMLLSFNFNRCCEEMKESDYIVSIQNQLKIIYYLLDRGISLTDEMFHSLNSFVPDNPQVLYIKNELMFRFLFNPMEPIVTKKDEKNEKKGNTLVIDKNGNFTVIDGGFSNYFKQMDGAEGQESDKKKEKKCPPSMEEELFLAFESLSKKECPPQEECPPPMEEELFLPFEPLSEEECPPHVLPEECSPRVLQEECPPPMKEESFLPFEPLSEEECPPRVLPEECPSRVLQKECPPPMEEELFLPFEPLSEEECPPRVLPEECPSRVLQEECPPPMEEELFLPFEPLSEEECPPCVLAEECPVHVAPIKKKRCVIS